MNHAYAEALIAGVDEAGCEEEACVQENGHGQEESCCCKARGEEGRGGRTFFNDGPGAGS
jgi:hypothetical protein